MIHSAGEKVVVGEPAPTLSRWRSERPSASAAPSAGRGFTLPRPLRRHSECAAARVVVPGGGDNRRAPAGVERSRTTALPSGSGSARAGRATARGLVTSQPRSGKPRCSGPGCSIRGTRLGRCQAPASSGGSRAWRGFGSPKVRQKQVAEVDRHAPPSARAAALVADRRRFSGTGCHAPASPERSRGGVSGSVTAPQSDERVVGVGELGERLSSLRGARMSQRTTPMSSPTDFADTSKSSD